MDKSGFTDKKNGLYQIMIYWKTTALFESVSNFIYLIFYCYLDNYKQSVL